MEVTRKVKGGLLVGMIDNEVEVVVDEKTTTDTSVKKPRKSRKENKTETNNEN